MFLFFSNSMNRNKKSSVAKYFSCQKLENTSLILRTFIKQYEPLNKKKQTHTPLHCVTCVCSILHDEAIKQVGYKSSHHVVNYYLWQRCIAHMCGAWYAKLLNNFPNVILILGFKPPCYTKK